MTYKEKIRADILAKIEILDKPVYNNDWCRGKIEGFKEILSFIDSLPSKEEPKFNVGDTIRHKETGDVLYIDIVDDEGYHQNSDFSYAPIEDQDQWELVKEPKKCMFTQDNYTDDDRKVLCEDCDDDCEYAKRDLKERYKRIAQSESFKEAYDGKSISEEEPVSIDFEQELYKAFGQVKDFTLGMRIAKRFYDMGKNSQEPVSEDLEEAAMSYGKSIVKQACDELRKEYGGEYTLGEDNVLLVAKYFKAGAKWQKEYGELA